MKKSKSLLQQINEKVSSPPKVSPDVIEDSPADDLTDKELGIYHGFNPNSENKETKFNRFKSINIKSIPAMIDRGVGLQSPVHLKHHKISDLPISIRTPLVALQGPLFGLLTSMKVEDMHVIGTYGGQHQINTQHEVAAYFKWLVTSGIECPELVADLSQKVKGVTIFQTEGITHLVLDNASGKFIISWPSVFNKHTSD